MAKAKMQKMRKMQKTRKMKGGIDFGNSFSDLKSAASKLGTEALKKGSAMASELKEETLKKGSTMASDVYA